MIVIKVYQDSVKHSHELPNVQDIKAKLSNGDIAICKVRATEDTYLLTSQSECWMRYVEETLEMKVARLENEIIELRNIVKDKCV